jgi:non-homologous end joining protein Ku
MTYREWVIVTLAFTDLFDIAKEIAPERIKVDNVFTAGKILQAVRERIGQESPLVGYRYRYTVTPAPSRSVENMQSWQKRNEALEKKKQAQREELNDLTDTLKTSIENAEKDRQGES